MLPGDKQEALTAMAQYIESLQKFGRLGRETIRQLGVILKAKSDLFDRRYIKCVLFPEYSKGARIPSPHTLATGIWKVETTFIINRTGVDAAMADVGFICDLEMGQRNGQFFYLYNIDKGAFSTYPTHLYNGKGVVLQTARVGEGAAMEYGISTQMAMEYASVDPISIYPRFRLVSAALSIVPVELNNTLAEVSVTQADDFDLQIQITGAATGGTNIPPGQVLVDYLATPVDIIRDALEIDTETTLYTFAPGNGAATAVADPAHTAFFGAADGMNDYTVVGLGVRWNPYFDAHAAAQGLLSRWFGTGKVLTKNRIERGSINEQAIACGKLRASGWDFLHAYLALNIGNATEERLWRPEGEAGGAFTAARIKEVLPKAMITAIQKMAGSTDIFDVISQLIRSIFPLLTLPKPKPKRMLARAKIQESPYQKTAPLAEGMRIVYLPRSSKATAFKDLEEMFEDAKKDVFWGATQGLMPNDKLKVVITRHYEGVPHQQWADMLGIKRIAPDARSIELVDRISTLAPDLVHIPPSKLQDTYMSVKDELGFIITPDQPVYSKTLQAMQDVAAYDADIGN